MPTFWSTPREGTYRGKACTTASWYVGRCAVHVWIRRDEPKVFIGGGDSWDRTAREADALELEALAHRFRSEELRAAAERVGAIASKASIEADGRYEASG
jgi:hypothetical protein